MGALASFTLIAIAGREAAKGIDTIQLMLWRSVIGVLVLVAIVAVRRGGFGGLGTTRPGLHGLRNIIHWVAQFSWLYALTRMPLAELFALEFTAPLWVALLAPLIIGERLTTTRLMAVALGFIGILVVVRPGAAPLGEGTVFGLSCAIGFALSMMATKRLLATDSAFTVLFWMQAMQAMLGVIIVGGGHFSGLLALTKPDLPTFGWIAATSVLGLTAHYALAKAFSLADAIIVAPMDFFRLPLIAVVGVVVYAEPLDPWIVAGAAIVILANLVNIRGERGQKPHAR